MANSYFMITEGNGDKNIATYSISETQTKQIQRIALNGSDGITPNYEFAILASQATTSATRTSADFTNNVMAAGILIHVKISSLSSTPTYTPSIEWKTTSGNYITLWTAAAAISANSDKVYWLSPGQAGTASSSITEAKGLHLPLQWRLTLTFGGSGSATTQVDACYLF
jgi:hypothetical protein